MAQSDAINQHETKMQQRIIRKLYKWKQTSKTHNR